MFTIVNQTKGYSIPVTPMATPRPRARIVRPKGKPEFVSVYNEPNYMKWKEKLARMISDLNIPKGNYNTVNLILFIPIPESYRRNRAKAMRMHNTLHESKPDVDNFQKAFFDALQHNDEYKSFNMPIEDDSTIANGSVRKIWVDDPVGKITFSLARVEIDPLISMR